MAQQCQAPAAEIARVTTTRRGSFSASCCSFCAFIALVTVLVLPACGPSTNPTTHNSTASSTQANATQSAKFAPSPTTSASGVFRSTTIASNTPRDRSTPQMSWVSSCCTALSQQAQTAPAHQAIHYQSASMYCSNTQRSNAPIAAQKEAIRASLKSTLRELAIPDQCQ